MYNNARRTQRRPHARMNTYNYLTNLSGNEAFYWICEHYRHSKCCPCSVYQVISATIIFQNVS